MLLKHRQIRQMAAHYTGKSMEAVCVILKTEL